MTSLTGINIYLSYGDLLTTTNSGQGLSATLQPIQDGLGQSSPMQIALNAINFNRIGGNTFQLDSVNLTAAASDINSVAQPNPILPGTGGVTVPVGTTAQRDPIPKNGEIRYNTSLNALEAYQNGAWGSLAAGSVLGPPVSIAGDIAIFSDTTGKLLSDSNVNIRNVPTPLLALGHGNSLIQDVQISGVDILNFGSSISNDVGVIFRQTDYVLGIFPNTITNKFPNIVLGFSNPSSTDSAFELTEGAILLSRLTTVQRNALIAIDGMIIYNTDTEAFNFYQNGVWVDLATGAVLSVSGTANQIVTTGSSSVVVSIANNPTLPGTADVLIPAGTTSQRPGVPVNGMFRYNTTMDVFEGFESGSWITFNTGGTVTSITAGSNLTGGTITTSGTIALNNIITGLTSIGVGDLSLSTNTISTTGTNENISILPNGTGSVLLGAAPVSITSTGVLTSSAIDTGTLTANTLAAFDLNILATGGNTGLISFFNANNTRSVSFAAPGVIPANVIWTLPQADGTTGQVLTTDGFSNLSWQTVPASNANAKYILQTAFPGLPNAQALDALGTGLLKINSSGVVQIAIPDTDYATLATITIILAECNAAATTAIDAADAALVSEGAAGAFATAAAASAAAAAVSAGVLVGATSGTFILKQSNALFPNAQSIGTLTDGLLKNSVSAGIGTLSTAVAGTDYYAPGFPTFFIDTTSTTLNLFMGTDAGNITATGINNIGIGKGIQFLLTSGNNNTGIGQSAMAALTSGSRNIAISFEALEILSSGNDNIGIGYRSLNSIITNSSNIGIGSNTFTLSTGNNNTSIGHNAGSSQNSYTNCTFIGYGTDASVNNLTNASAIGYNASVGASNSMVLGSAGTKIGIGTNIPSYPLHIDNNGSLSLQNNSGTPSTNSSGTVLYSSSGNLFLINGDGTTVNLSISPSNAAKYIVQTVDGSLPNAQSLGTLTTGLLKNTVTGSTGVLSTAVAGTDYYSATHPTTIIDSASPNFNLFIGTNSGNSLVSGTFNTGFGGKASFNLTSGSSVTAVGYQAATSVTTGSRITAMGDSAASSVVSANDITAYGYHALQNSTAGLCTAFGSSTLSANTTGIHNSAFGTASLTANVTGSDNTALGYHSGNAQTTYTQCTFIGSGADASVNNLTNASAIGYNASVGASNSMVLGSSGTNIGIGTSSPTRTLTVIGGIIYNHVLTAINYNVLDTDYFIGVNTGSAVTITLPAASASNAGQVFIIKDQTGTGAAHHITIQTAGGNIDAGGTATISTNYGSMAVYSNGTNYFIW